MPQQSLEIFGGRQLTLFSKALFWKAVVLWFADPLLFTLCSYPEPVRMVLDRCKHKTWFDPVLPKTREKQKGAKKEECKTGSKQLGKIKDLFSGRREKT